MGEFFPALLGDVGDVVDGGEGQPARETAHEGVEGADVVAEERSLHGVGQDRVGDQQGERLVHGVSARQVGLGQTTCGEKTEPAHEYARPGGVDGQLEYYFEECSSLPCSWWSYNKRTPDLISNEKKRKLWENFLKSN